MSEHEPCIGATDEWFTPRAIFDALALTFDLDPCSQGVGHWVPAHHIYTKADDGLSQPWDGLVWMNPPFGGRNGVIPWLERFFSHGSGIGLVAARTSAGWFHDWMPKAETLLFPRGKTKFVRPDGSVGGSPGTGAVLFAVGNIANDALQDCGLGLFIDRRPRRPVSANRAVTPRLEQECAEMRL